MYVTDAQGFYNHLKSQTEFVQTNLLNAKQSEVVCGFCTRRSPLTVWGKIRAVKSFVNQMIKTGVIPKIKVEIRLGGEGLASMLDQGKIVFYKRFLTKQAYHESVLAVLHEIAHVVLWATPEYQALKSCDVEFINRYVNDVSLTVVTPIEYYANVISLSWLKTAIGKTENQKRAEQLTKQLEWLTAKLNKAKEKI